MMTEEALFVANVLVSHPIYFSGFEGNASFDELLVPRLY
jgi:hypothetical protein